MSNVILFSSTVINELKINTKFAFEKEILNYIIILSSKFIFEIFCSKP